MSARFNFLSALFLCFSVLLNPCFGQVSAENTVLSSDSVSLYTKISGKGPYLIYVHGGPGAWSKSFEDLGGKNLEDEFTMVYYDQRGCGRSQSPKNGNFSLERMVLDIEEIRRYYGIDEFYLMGHSFGGIFITQYANDYPQHLKGLILLNSILNVSQSLNGQADFFVKTLFDGVETADAQKESMPRFSYYQNLMAEKGIIYQVLTDSKENYEIIDSVDAKNPSDYAFASQALNIPIYLSDFSSITRNIKTPTLIFSGKRDFAIGVNHYLNFQFPNSKLVFFEKGHLAYYEENDLLKKELMGFKNH